VSASRRGAARLIDAVMQVLCGALLGRLLGARWAGVATAIAMLVPSLQMAYVWDGQSFGKRAMSLRVVRRDGGLVSLWLSCKRELATLLCTLPCFANAIFAILSGRSLADR